MATTKQKKGEIIDKLEKLVSKRQALLLTSFTKIDVEDLREFRKKLKEGGMEYQVIKKTLLNKVLGKEKFTELDLKKIAGSVGMVFSAEDPLAPAKTAYSFAKSKGSEFFQVLGGWLSGQFIAADKVAELAEAGSRDNLYARLLRQFNAPASKLVYAIKAISEKK